MPDPATLFTSLVLLLLGGVAAITDARSGTIPNCLTLPPLLLAPLAQGIALGPGALGASIAGMLICGAVPLVLFLRGGMGGGDVKLLAAIGAVAGMRVGLEVQLVSLLLSGLFALCLLTHRGELWATLLRALRPRAAARESSSVGPGLEVRLGVPVLLALLTSQAPLLIDASLWSQR
jgi:prepilin peptidase CpaA